jgi:hypothetical protein
MKDKFRFRIRSGGQTGVDRAALDAAIAAGHAYQGWCPKGGWAEDFGAPPGLLTKYPGLRETSDADPAQRSERNVRDSDATLLLVPQARFASPGTALTQQCADKLGRPLTIVVYSKANAAQEIAAFFTRFARARSINIAGPRESEAPGAYDDCRKLLIECLGSTRPRPPPVR